MSFQKFIISDLVKIEVMITFKLHDLNKIFQYIPSFLFVVSQVTIKVFSPVTCLELIIPVTILSTLDGPSQLICTFLEFRTLV